MIKARVCMHGPLLVFQEDWMMLHGQRFSGLIVVVVMLMGIASAADWPADLKAVANGESDATAVLQRIVQETDGLVDIPAGRYRITNTIMVAMKDLGYRGIRGANGATQIIMVLLTISPHR